jgi:hypothetical protein
MSIFMLFLLENFIFYILLVVTVLTLLASSKSFSQLQPVPSEDLF